MLKSRVSRRKALQLGAASAALPLVHIRTAHAAGKVSIGFWDHWVPAGNAAMKKQVDAWAAKNKVEVQADFITSVGNKNLLTIAAEAQAKTGHDVQAFPTWEVLNNQDHLEPIDDVMGHLEKQYGPVNSVCAYLAKFKGHWRAIPTSSGTQNKPPLARISLMKSLAGIDLQAMYPADKAPSAEADKWDWDMFLKAAQACNKGGKAFGIGLGQTSDSEDFAGALFKSFGADLVDAKGDITLNTDAVKQALEYGAKLVKEFPADVVAYDDGSNNRALISGKSALICNPPSAWAVAKRDAPEVAADCWTVPSPKGPKGRFVPYLPYFWGVWNFAKNKSAAKELITYLMQREQIEERCAAVVGYDIPPFDSMSDFKVWSEVEPPKGVVYNYPIRKASGSVPSIAMSPAPPDVAVKAYNVGMHSTMLAKLKSGMDTKAVISWAQNELEGMLR